MKNTKITWFEILAQKYWTVVTVSIIALLLFLCLIYEIDRYRAENKILLTQIGIANFDANRTEFDAKKTKIEFTSMKYVYDMCSASNVSMSDNWTVRCNVKHVYQQIVLDNRSIGITADFNPDYFSNVTFVQANDAVNVKVQSVNFSSEWFDVDTSQNSKHMSDLNGQTIDIKMIEIEPVKKLCLKIGNNMTLPLKYINTPPYCNVTLPPMNITMSWKDYPGSLPMSFVDKELCNRLQGEWMQNSSASEYLVLHYGFCTNFTVCKENETGIEPTSLLVIAQISPEFCSQNVTQQMEVN